MTNDELRALADALEPMSGAPRFEGMNVLAFCKWLRAQAEAQPVGYATANGLRMLQQDDATVLLYKHDYLIRPDHVPLYAHPAPAVPQAEPKREPVGTLTIRDDMGAEITFHRSFTMRPRQTFAIYPNWDLLTHDIPTRGAFVVNAPKEIGNEFLPFHPAPAVPQAEPCIGNDPICPCQDGDACHYKDAADGTKAWPIPQAEQRPDGWQVVPVVPTKSMNSAGLSAVNQYGKRSVWETYRAMLAAAPNVPQAEPDDDDDALVLGEPDILTPEDIRRLVPQAEPKREPLREEGVVATLVREGVNKHKAREIVAWIKQHGIGGSDER